jgi:hypothetical protein
MADLPTPQNLTAGIAKKASEATGASEEFTANPDNWHKPGSRGGLSYHADPGDTTASDVANASYRHAYNARKDQ